jgi:hypothetical protein
MQRCTGEEGDPAAIFDQCVIDRNEGDQQKKEPLDNSSYPDATGTKDTYALTKQSDHNFLQGIDVQSVVSEFGKDAKVL